MEIRRLSDKILRNIYMSLTDKKMCMLCYDNVTFDLWNNNEFNTKYLYFLIIIVYVYGFVKFVQISDYPGDNVRIPIKVIIYYTNINLLLVSLYFILMS